MYGRDLIYQLTLRPQIQDNKEQKHISFSRFMAILT